jgi:hypothetical protein
MSTVGQISNGESGLSVRTKLNLVIDRTTVFDTAANFTSNNPTLNTGQLGIETDDLLTVPKFKIGDGANDWSTLPYFNDSILPSLQDVINVNNTVDGFLTQSLDTQTNIGIENDLVSLNSTNGTDATQVAVNSTAVTSQVNTTSQTITDGAIDFVTSSLTKNTVEIATINDIKTKYKETFTYNGIALTLSNTCSFMYSLNWGNLALNEGVDYSFSGTTLTILNSNINNGDILYATYE